MCDSVTSNITNTTTTEDDHKSLVHVDLLALFYIVGISGCFLALLHLYTRKTFRNTKQAFMLKLVNFRKEFECSSGLLSREEHLT